jgi:hypothetical protein
MWHNTMKQVSQAFPHIGPPCQGENRPLRLATPARTFVKRKKRPGEKYEAKNTNKKAAGKKSAGICNNTGGKYNIPVPPYKTFALPTKALALQDKAFAPPTKALALQQKASALPTKALALQDKALTLQTKAFALPHKVLTLPTKASALQDKDPAPKHKKFILTYTFLVQLYKKSTRIPH